VLSEEAIKYRAMMMGITTGRMPDVEFIWDVQKADGLKICFGRGQGCSKRDCRWRKECLALDFFAEPPVDGRERSVKKHSTISAEKPVREFVG